ncbi:MAG: DUF1566 domain-containing protein [Alphaproteobacteria bacterium]|nr:DUF1566 domain-containing protein [Alphaproteobacteria bacterium]
MKFPRFGFFAFCLLVFSPQTSTAQLAGSDTAPGASCAGFPTGATRLVADADGNGADVTLVCDGTNWQAAGVRVGNDTASCVAAKEGTIRYTGGSPAWEYCDGSGWLPFESAGGGGCSAPADCPDPGDTCTDGSKFAGFVNIGEACEVLYVAAADQVSDQTDAWGLTGDTGADDWENGVTNHRWIVANRTLSSYPAFETCANLSLHTHDDWYLPAYQEFFTLTQNSSAITGFEFSEDYWISTEYNGINGNAFMGKAGPPGGSNTVKTATNNVRCVRREGACPDVGNVCGDGTVYAGFSPDGDVPMFTMPADAGQIDWNNGTGNLIDTSMVNCANATPGTSPSCQTGEDNTTFLVGLSNADAPYEAALFCHCLGKDTTGVCASDPASGFNAYGYSDWYLPAQDELYELRVNRTAIGGFDVTGAWPSGFYWSSSESGASGAARQRFDNGTQGTTNKNNTLSVRCVRK